MQRSSSIDHRKVGVRGLTTFWFQLQNTLTFCCLTGRVVVLVRIRVDDVAMDALYQSLVALSHFLVALSHFLEALS